ncbi:MAG: HEAT repeat domain-containing protein [Thermodesulfobacteriota bacterium]
MKRLVFPAAVFAGGLALCQALFTILVFVSNLELQIELSVLRAAGYLVIPNKNVIDGMDGLVPAFCGAVFFTATAGALLCLAGFFAAWLKKRIFPESRFFGALITALWLAGAAACNVEGWNPDFTIIFIAVPAAVFAASMRWMTIAQPGDGYIRTAHIIAVIAAAIAWLPCLQQDVFLDIRDRVLLSNPAGRQVNEFYYTYTLYPAEIIKPPAARLLNACTIENKGSEAVARNLSGRLIEFDFLPVSNAQAASITVRAGALSFEFARDGKVLFETKRDDFFSRPGTTLETFSDLADKSEFLRLFTLAGLASGFPLGLYIFVHCGLCLAIWFVRSIPLRSISASGICLGLAAAFLVPFYAEQRQPGDIESIRAAIESGHWYEQRSGLKAIAGQDRDPVELGVSRELAESPHVPVRYWMARALRESESPEAISMLVTMTHDPSPNVACMAYAGLAGTGDSRTAEFIRSRIKGIEHWYVQQYAYKAMRQLGWKQKLPYTN